MSRIKTDSILFLRLIIKKITLVNITDITKRSEVGLCDGKVHFLCEFDKKRQKKIQTKGVYSLQRQKVYRCTMNCDIY